MITVDGIILAGSSKEDKLGESCKALIDIGGRPMVSYVLDVLKSSPSVKNIVVAGPRMELNRLFGGIDRTTVVSEGESLIDSLMNALEALQPQGNVLIATGDIPLLTREALDDFLKRCSKKLADVYYPIVPKEANERIYPGIKRTYIRFKEGTFTGGNLFLVNPQVVAAAAGKARAFVEKRKSPLALAQLVGWKFLIKFLFHTATLAETEALVSRIFGIKGGVIISPYPEVGIDVDKPSDLTLVRNALEKHIAPGKE
ncbi:nucleotidyltransferase family protein [Dehalobacterium formicoaceticum]|uniref:Nucleotidyltransferase family protein n=1 Tax=Dehalobacterium formicoaceticum TaxID=51515 RepID=A0ABT1Y607_9FIRM|nr:nucleotidyltransferase family protein [Dehalobacterium formicoaceticum]MCR6545349.1 nucleotidyltransferase family protein [Dehalobacterium formicoaceticum]